MGRGYITGQFGRPDVAEALRAFERARSLGDNRAAVFMAQARIYGWGGAGSRVQAGMELLEREAAEGNGKAVQALIAIARDGIPKQKLQIDRSGSKG